MKNLNLIIPLTLSSAFVRPGMCFLHQPTAVVIIRSTTRTSLMENETIPSPSSSSTTSYMPKKLLPPIENLMASSTHRLSRMERIHAINDVKRFVESRLESDLNVSKV